ncbi:MAG TPA: tetratricopeptide repeat protein, partial [Gammaproteobacteria bacterium]|nr:tetratricopeptide repeat protein [Gammaproteobacteria bacterium]
MSTGPLLTLLAITALWPFGRDRDKTPDPTGTIKDLEASVVEIDTSASIANSEARAMESYRLFLDLASEDPVLRSEAMRRLADLRLETFEAEQLQSNLQSLGGNFGGTIDMYERLLESYPSYAKNDLVLYQLARAYEAEGRLEEALHTLDRLISGYPQTPYFDEAQFRRGETLFVDKRYAEAEGAYSDVLVRGADSAFYEQALYKHGWALFKQQQHAEGLPSFFALLDRKFQTGGTGNDADPVAQYSAMGRAEQELVADTFRVLSISFSYLDGPEAVSDYFSANGSRPYAYMVYTNLGDLYLEQERFQDAADTYRALVEQDPYHAKAPLVQVEIIEAFKQGGFADLVLDA